jgi:superfamily II DNA or RNA helicase
MIMRIELSNELNLLAPPEPLAQKIRDTFTIENPAWLDNKKMSRWNGKTHRWLKLYRRRRDGLSIPRGAMGLIIYFCREMNIQVEIDDRRPRLPDVDYVFNGILKPYQEKAVREILRRDFGVLEAPTGSGKTITALATIAERRQPCLVIVHSKELLSQWIESIEMFLGIPQSEIGIIGNGVKRIGALITVGIVNSIYPIAEQMREHIGYLVVDECHRTPSRTFTEAVSAFDSKYMLGLSATPYRRDGLTKLITWHLGRQIEVKQADLTEADIIFDVEVIARETAFVTDYDASEEYTLVLSELTEDTDRNQLIAKDVVREAMNEGGICLVLTDRKEHCNSLAALIASRGIETAILTGDVPNGSRRAIVERLNAGTIRVLIATGQLIGEGFDCKGLSTLFLATPIKFSGRLIQYLGRVVRPAPGKDHAKIYDYIDAHVSVLKASAKARQRVYQNIGEGE